MVGPGPLPMPGAVGQSVSAPASLGEVRIVPPGHLQIRPYHYFAAASVECQDLFDHGHVYGCISLTQAVAEGLSSFIALTNSMRKGKDCQKRVAVLRRRGFISEKSERAFNIIWSDDRNDFHHMNHTITTDRERLRARAEECIRALYGIESEIFGYELDGPRVRPRQPKYWPSNPDGTGPVYLDFERQRSSS